MSEDVTECFGGGKSRKTLSVEGHFTWLTSKESGNFGLKENYVEFNSVEFSNLVIEPTRCEEKVEVQQDVTVHSV